MKAEAFITKLKEYTPSKEELQSIGFNSEDIETFFKKYVGIKKATVHDSHEDELLHLVSSYDLRNVELGMITFYDKIKQNSDFYFVGKMENDLMVVNKITKGVQVYESDSPKHLLWDCAGNGSKFLDAILHCVPFFNRCMFDDELWNNSKIILNVATESSEIAGGDKYLNFFKTYLGYFE